MTQIPHIHRNTNPTATFVSTGAPEAREESSCCNHIWRVISEGFNEIVDLITSLFKTISTFFQRLCGPGELAHRPISVDPINPTNQPNSPPVSPAIPYDPARATAINAGSLALAPRIVLEAELARNLREAASQVTDLSELGRICQRLSPEYARNAFNFASFVNRRELEPAEYFNTLGSYFKTIIVELRKETTPIELKRAALRALSRGYVSCPLGKFEAGELAYKMVTHQLLTAEKVALEKVQEFKEKVFIDHYHLQQNPSFLNHIRREVGEEFGLNRHPDVLNDPQIDAGRRESAQSYRTAFQENFRENALVEYMQDALNTAMGEAEKAAVLGPYLRNKLDTLVTSGHLSTQEQRDDIEEEYLPWGARFSENGVRFLLLQLGILTQ